MTGETRVLANCGYGTHICQTLSQTGVFNVSIMRGVKSDVGIAGPREQTSLF
jgi:hypothetical protein